MRVNEPRPEQGGSMQDNNNPLNGQPEGQNPYSMNQGFGVNQPSDVTQPFQAADANQGYGVNQQGDMNMNQGYGMNQPNMNQGFGMNQPGSDMSMNQGYGMGAGSDMNTNQGFGINQPNMNQGYGMGAGSDMNANQGFGVNQPNMNQGYGMGAGGDMNMNQGFGMNQPGGYPNPTYGYGAGGPGYQQQQKQNKKKLGAVVAAIAVIFVAIVGIIVGIVLKKDNEPEDGIGSLAAGPTSAPREEVTPTPEPTDEPTPEPTDEPTPEPTDEPDVPEFDPGFAVQGDMTDYRASFTGYYGESYILIKNNQWDDYNLVYADTQEAYSLVDYDVRYFAVIGEDVYFTSRDSDTNTYSFWKIKLKNGSEPEQLLNGTQVCAFSYYEGLIYYDNYDDYYELYCYDPVTGSNEKIDQDSLGYYYILDGYIYYERIDDHTMCKMKLDGSDKHTLFALSDYGLNNLSCLTAFDVGGYIFFAFNTPDGDMLLTTEDGSAYELIAEDLMDFDLNQDIYYAEGSIYYSAANGTEVHKLDIEEYLNDANMETIPDSIICDHSFYYFEVTDGLIYVELYGGNNEVEVMDCLTGEIYNTFDFS